MDASKSSFLIEWKEKMTQVIRFKFPPDKISDKEISVYLDQVITKNLNDRKVLLVNNYTNKVSRASILQMIELIRNNGLICAGGGCLFLPHGVKRNLLIDFILYIMDGRGNAKKQRKKFPKGSKEWSDWDLVQLAFKLIINSLYGCMGYPGFTMFNIFLAEAITNQGRHIITSAVNAIEGFLGDNMLFENSSEVFHVIRTIDAEFKKKTPGYITDTAKDMFRSEIDFDKLPDMCTDRFLKHCIFAYNQSFIDTLRSMFSQMSSDELLMMYFKNNFMEFSRLWFIKEKIRLLLLETGPLLFCEDEDYRKRDKNGDIIQDSVPILNELWELYDFFVHYNYPIFDRLQKAMYLDKSKSLYTDTDSVFISLDQVVQYVFHEVFTSPEDANMSADDLRFTAANFTLSIANRMISAAMATLCRSINVGPEFTKLLKMKNEFFFSRIMFSDVKKRYVSLSLLQEGQLLYDDSKFGSYEEAKAAGKPGLPEIKGFDFKKAGTKQYVRDFCTNLCLDEILYPEKINPVRIFKKVLALKAEMESSIMHGNMSFFKQANVKKPEYYKNPFSTQGVCAVTLWNALMPDKALDFPTDINVIPIKEMTWPRGKVITGPEDADGSRPIRSTAKGPEHQKNIAAYAAKFPEAYNRLHANLYMSENSLIQHMTLTSIAIPKNLDYELPDFITYLFDTESVINDTISLILPLMKSVGIKSFQVSADVEYMSNMVEL